MFGPEFLAKLRKYKVPYHEYEDGLSFPAPAYTYNDTLKWVRRKCPTLYYKLTGECKERPCGYSWMHPNKPVKKRYKTISYYLYYADFYGSDDKKVWTKIERKPILNNTVEAPVKLMEYEYKSVDYVAIVKTTKRHVRRLAV